MTKEPLWRPSPQRIAEAQMTAYRAWLKQHKGLHFDHYEALWQWSTEEFEAFWESIWEYGEVISHRPYQRVVNQQEMPGVSWFEGATLNYAEHILAPGTQAESVNAPAIVAESETRPRVEVSWQSLREQTGALTASLKQLGLEMGDRAVAYLPNIPETAVAMLSVSSCGAIWSMASPEMGIASVLDRFHQIEPKILFTIDGYRYKGKDYDRREVVVDLVKQLPSVETVIFISYLHASNELDLSAVREGKPPQVVSFAETVSTPAKPDFTPVPFAHPLWILYSSGTTGPPKAIIHSHGGIVLQNIKYIRLHLDIGPSDRFFWFSSTTWGMWNSLITTLISGATILLFDGNPGYPDLNTLWRYAEREKATFYGTSPTFISLCRKAGITPGASFDLSSLRTVGSTGSPLSEEGYRWIYEKVHPDVLLFSVTGGTDFGAGFLSACPILPVYAGEMSCRELGVATCVYDDNGKPVMDEVGELVMTKPIPCLPIGFWGDPEGRRYYESYFDTFPGVWRHGDWLQLISHPEAVGGIVFGRSDATINRQGIRMGSSEIYRVVESFPEVADSLVVDLEYLGKPSYLALFVVLTDPEAAPIPSPEIAGKASTTEKPSLRDTGMPETLRIGIMNKIRTHLSARHAPNEIFAIQAVPYTISGKKMEVPVKKILLGQSANTSANRDAMGNPESIDWFVEFARGRNS